MIKTIYKDSGANLEVKPITSVGQAAEFKYSAPTYKLFKLITICLTIVLLAIIASTTVVKYKQVNNVCIPSTK